MKSLAFNQLDLKLPGVRAFALFTFFLFFAAQTVSGQTTQTYSNPAAIVINDNAPANPYPSSIAVSGLTATVTKVTATLTNFRHAYPGDVGVLLVSPSGANVGLMIRCGGGTLVNNINLTFDDAAANGVPNPLTTGTYKPSQCNSILFPAPAPAAPYGTTLAAFNGSNPNGTWQLYVFDAAMQDAGSITGGFQLSITTFDQTPSLQFSPASYGGSEGSTVLATVTRTGNLAAAASATYNTSDNTAIGGAACGGSVDYVQKSGTIDFPANVLSQQIPVTLCSDFAASEGTENFNLTLNGATGGTIGTPATASISIFDSATFAVNTSADNETNGCGTGNCTLREAVAAANANPGNDTINLGASLNGQTITLDQTLGEIVVGNSGSLVINGVGANQTTIDGGTGTNRIFYFDGATVTLSRVKLQGGNGAGANASGDGGAIYANGGTLTLDAVTIQNNVNAAGVGGGVLLNGGANHRIINSTFNGNTALQCGGFYSSGSSLFVANSTFSGNSALVENDVAGSGLCNLGTLIIRNSTVVGNTAGGANSAGGGIFNSGSFNLGNTIVAGNTSTNQMEIYNEGTFTSAGNNLVGDSAGDSTDTNTAITYQPAGGFADVLDTPPMLGSLTIANGGQTPTHALLTGSPAIDTGDNAKAVDPFNNSVLTRDQRGFTRIVDAPLFAAIVDIGAFEFNNAPTAAVVTIGGRITTGRRGIQNALITLTDSIGIARTVLSGQLGYYRFANVETGQTYTISIAGKKYSFANSIQVRSISDNTDDINFVADN